MVSRSVGKACILKAGFPLIWLTVVASFPACFSLLAVLSVYHTRFPPTVAYCNILVFLYFANMVSFKSVVLSLAALATTTVAQINGVCPDTISSQANPLANRKNCTYNEIRQGYLTPSGRAAYSTSD